MSRNFSRLKREGSISSRCCNGKGPPLEFRGESPYFSRVAAGTLGFLSSYDRDLRDPLLLPCESQVSMKVNRGLSGYCYSQYQDIGPYLEMSSETQGSSPVLTWILRFLWSFNRGVRPRLMWRHTSPLSSQAEKVVSGFLSS